MSKTAPVPHDDLDNYDVGDLSDDPFRTPTPPPSKKRKEADTGLGIDTEVAVQKRARVPNIKLDEDRLLGPAGIPKLQTRARKLKIKGKGHEFSDAARLLSFYQLWLDDLFPKAKFLDALAMVEKAGHKKKLVTARSEWINSGAPKPTTAADFLDLDDNGDAGVSQGSTDKTTTGGASMERPITPPARRNEADGDDDLYGATPRAARINVPILGGPDQPDDNELEALMAEAENHDKTRKNPVADDLDDEDLDALIAEAEGFDAGQKPPPSKLMANIARHQEDEFADDEAALREMEEMW
ncbi:unnamed protein product [Clonostachys chloroleuca]|uniref:Chromosome segregation in meiosis protein n=1 Tax=Clonostachys chloroleuca TaxID=1926264 RepID=A0AA35Q0N3_9HYPO|nr:unnamed protein product [Clonostachys chloroleuca]